MFEKTLNLGEFIVTFISRLRRDTRAKSKPSVRQSFAISDFLTARYFRDQLLQVSDLVQAAILTTYYEDQPIAKEIALDVLHTFLNAKMVDDANPTYRGLVKVVEINNYLQNYTKDEKILNDLFQVDYLNLQDLTQLVDIIFKNKKDSMTLKDLQYFATAGQLEKYLPEITDPNQQIYAKQLLERKDWTENLADLMNKDMNKFGQAVRTMERLGANSKELDPIVNQALEKLHNLEQYEALTQTIGHQLPLPDHLTKDLEPQELLKHLKDQNSPATASYLNYLKKQMEIAPLPEFTLEELLEGYRDTQEWQNFLTDFVEEHMDQSSNSQKMEMAKQLQEKFPRNSSMAMQKEFLKQKSDLLKDLINTTKDATELQNLLKSLQAEEISYDPNLAQSKGAELELDPSNLQNLTPTPLSEIKQMIQKNLGDFDQFSNLLEQFPLNPDEAQDVLKTGVLSQNSSIIGALGHQNLQKTIDQFESLEGGKPVDLLLNGLAKGPGSNLLLQWYSHEQKISPEYKQKLQQLLQKTLIDLSLFEAKAHFGFIKRGHIKEMPELRIYMEGDSSENVAVEDTIENLLDQGKNNSQITENDILCRNEMEGQLKVLLILDMSGSMMGAKLANAVLTCMILLQVMHSQEISIVVFESNTRVLKDFAVPTDIDALSLELLNLHAEGGTQISQSLHFIVKKMGEIASNQLLLTVIFSDFGVYETEAELTSVLKKLQGGNLKLHLIATETPEAKIIALFQRYLNVNVVSVESPQQIPQILARILNDVR